MSLSEQLICYYIFSLTMLEQYVIVLQLIKKFLVKFTGCSQVFRGNVMRAKATCTETMLKGKSTDSYTHELVVESLKKA